MAENATKGDVQEIVSTAVNKAVEDLSGVISQLAQNMHNELTDIKGDISSLQMDVSGLQRDISEVKGDVADLKKSHDKLLNTLDHFLKRLDDNEADNVARDAQLALKTGVKLEY